MSLPYRKWSSLLRSMGFAIEWNSVAGGCRCTQFIKEIDGRRQVQVQIWATGNNRASHSFHGCSDTKPTDFTDVAEMIHAINHEATRTDGRYRPVGSCAKDGKVDGR